MRHRGKNVMHTVRLVRGVMENAYKLSIPLETEARSGLSWGTMEVVSEI